MTLDRQTDEPNHINSMQKHQLCAIHVFVTNTIILQMCVCDFLPDVYTHLTAATQTNNRYGHIHTHAHTHIMQKHNKTNQLYMDGCMRVCLFFLFLLSCHFMNVWVPRISNEQLSVVVVTYHGFVLCDFIISFLKFLLLFFIHLNI